MTNLTPQDEKVIAALRGNIVPQMTDDEMIINLTKRGIVVGAIVLDHQYSTKNEDNRYGRVLDIGSNIKPHSQDENKAPGFYIVIRWLKTSDVHNYTTTRINYKTAMSSLRVMSE